MDSNDVLLFLVYLYITYCKGPYIQLIRSTENQECHKQKCLFARKLFKFFEVVQWGLRGLYSSPNIIRVLKSNRMRWVEHAARISLLWNRKIHYRDYKSLLPVPVKSQVKAVRTSESYFFKMLTLCYNYVWILEMISLFRVFPSKLCKHFYCPARATCSAQFIYLNLITLIMLD